MRAADWAQAVVSFLALALGGTLAGGTVATIAGCNAVLGIDPATLAPRDGGTGAGEAATSRRAPTARRPTR